MADQIKTPKGVTADQYLNQIRAGCFRCDGTVDERDQ